MIRISPLQEYSDSKAYHKSDAPTINHFYEKLLKLKDLMNTRTGKRWPGKGTSSCFSSWTAFTANGIRTINQPDPKIGNSG